MKRVGVVTFHSAHNFGAVLQAWSVQRAVQTLGHDVEVIDYRPAVSHESRRRGLRRFVPSLGKLQMDRFLKREMPLSPSVLTSASAVSDYVDAAGFDALICGSDQVWLIYDHQGVDPCYFLGVGSSPDLRRLSYAPSAGPMTSFGPFADEVKQHLTLFDAISVRDRNTQSAVSELEVGEITRVVDPTLIADFSPLLKRARPRDEIVVVGGMTPAADDYIHAAAKALGLPVRAVGTRTPAADKQQPFAGPGDWLHAVSGARLVITSLFHGAAVSMACRTPFIALDCGGRAFKLSDLLTHLNCPERLLLAGDDGVYAFDAGALQMSYDALGPRLEAAADASRTWLKGALDG